MKDLLVILLLLAALGTPFLVLLYKPKPVKPVKKQSAAEREKEEIKQYLNFLSDDELRLLKRYLDAADPLILAAVASNEDFCLACAVKNQRHQHFENDELVTDRIARNSDLSFLLKQEQKSKVMVTLTRAELLDSLACQLIKIKKGLAK